MSEVRVKKTCDRRSASIDARSFAEGNLRDGNAINRRDMLRDGVASAVQDHISDLKSDKNSWNARTESAAGRRSSNDMLKQARASDGVQVAPRRDRRAVRALRFFVGFELRELLCDGACDAVT